MEESVPQRSRKVLIADDDEDSASMLMLLLQQDGHEVHVSSSGRDTLALAARLRPDVVVLDLRLGDMTGFEVACELRERAGAAGLLLVALSGLDDDDVGERCRAAGFDSHWLKPIRDFVGFRRVVGSAVRS